MSTWSYVGLGLIVAGLALASPGIAVLGALTLISRWLATLWSRYGLHGVRYERSLGQRQAVWGDDVELDLSVWNGKPLPLPWIAVDDFVSDGLRIRDVRLEESDRPGQSSLRSAWSLLWYERVIRHLEIVADRRGVYDFGPVRLSVADLFERGVNDAERPLPDRITIRPRSVPVRGLHRNVAPLGAERARVSLYEDPARFAGVRPWQAGDPLRRLHWRATARSGKPVSRRYEAVHERQLLIVLDVQTVEGPHWLLVFEPDLVEALCVTAASLARRSLAGGGACGLLVGARPLGSDRGAYVAPGAGHGQLGRIEDELARLRPISTVAFDRLLASVPRRVSAGATLLVLSGRSPTSYLDVLRRLQRGGYAVEYTAMGVHAEEHYREAVQARIPAMVGRLDPDWRTADALVVAP